MQKQQTMEIPTEKNRKVYYHRVGYNGLSKRLTLPIKWCILNEIREYDHLIIIERRRTLEIMTLTEFRRLYPELDGCDKQEEHGPVRW